MWRCFFPKSSSTMFEQCSCIASLLNAASRASSYPTVLIKWSSLDEGASPRRPMFSPFLDYITPPSPLRFSISTSQSFTFIEDNLLFTPSALTLIIMAVISILSATLAASVFASAVNGAAIARRYDYPAQPPCSYPYTPFNYVGCYIDPSIPNRALDFATHLDFQNMTVEKCTASCKGKFCVRDVVEWP